jgi:hypothetical protein
MDASNFGDSTGIFILYTLDTCRTSVGRSPAGWSFGAVHPQMIPLPAAARIEGVSRLEISGSHLDAKNSCARGGNGVDGKRSERNALKQLNPRVNLRFEQSRVVRGLSPTLALLLALDQASENHRQELFNSRPDAGVFALTVSGDVQARDLQVPLQPGEDV